MNAHKRKAGQSGMMLLEALVTMLLVTLGLITLGQLVAVGAVVAVKNRQREVATRVAQRFMEAAKGMNFSQLRAEADLSQPRPHDVYVRLANAQIYYDQAPPDNKYPTQAFPTGVTYTYDAAQGQMTVSVDVMFTHRGIARHVEMTTAVIDNGR